MTSIRDANIFHNRDLEELYQLQANLEVAEAGNKPYYLKIEGKGSDQKVILVQGRFKRFLASISTFFGAKAYNLNNVKQLICNELEGVRQASSAVTNSEVGSKLASSCEGVSRVFLACITSENCLNTKIDDKDHLNDRINSLVHAIKDHFVQTSKPLPAVKKDQVLQKPKFTGPIKGKAEQFLEENQQLLQRSIGYEGLVKIKAIAGEANRKEALKAALQRSLLGYVGVKASQNNAGEIGKLVSVGKGVFSKGPFATAGTKEHACYHLIRQKLDNCFAKLETEGNLAKQLDDYKEVAQVLAQAEALIQEYQHKNKQPGFQRLILALELEAFAQNIEGDTKLIETIKSLPATDLESLPKSHFEAIVEDIRKQHNTHLLAGFTARLQQIEDKKVAEPVVEVVKEERVLTQEEKKELLAQTVEVAKTPLVRLGIDVDAVLHDDRLNLDEKIRELIHAIPDRYDLVDEFVTKRLYTLDKTAYPREVGSLSMDLWRFLLNNLTRHDAYKRYEPSEALVEKRLSDIKDCAQFLTEAQIVCDAASIAPTFEVAQAKRAVLLMELRHLAYRLAVDDQSRFWEQLAASPLYIHDKPFTDSRYDSITTQELKQLYEKLCQLKPEFSLLKEEWLAHLSTLEAFERNVSLDDLTPRKDALELEKQAVHYIKQQVRDNVDFLPEAKCFIKMKALAEVPSLELSQYKRAVTLLVLRQLLLDAREFLNSKPKLHPLRTYTQHKIDLLMLKLAAGETSMPFSQKRLSTVSHQELELLALECLKALEPLQSHPTLSKSVRWTALGPKRREIDALLRAQI